MFMKNKGHLMKEEIKVKDLNYKYNDYGYIFNHSLTALSGLHEAEDNLKCLLDDNSIQICCTLSEQYINSIGVELTGKCLLVGTRDLYSQVDMDGDRTIPDSMMEYIYNGKLEDAYLVDTEDNYYNEAIVYDFNIRSMWCNPYCVKDNKEAKAILMQAKQLANKYNLELKIVQNKSLFY